METKDLLKRVSDNIVLKDNITISDNKDKSIIFLDGEDELRHFLNFLYLNGVKINTIDDELRYMKNAFSMIVSIITYGKKDITIEEIVNDGYLKGNLYQTDKKEEMAKYLLENIEKIEPNVYTDCEGLTYNTVHLKTI
jgi:hypothetical protein